MKTTIAVILFCIFSAPLLRAQTAKSAFFKTSDGVRIHYLEAGSGRAIVFIPGWTMPAWIWQKQIDEFSRKYHVVAVDPRSQGQSDKPTFGHLPEIRARDYKELVDYLELKQPALVGWSMACGELIKYVDQFGTDNVAGVVLVDGYLGGRPLGESFSGIAAWVKDMQNDRQVLTERFVGSMYEKKQSADYLKRVVDASMQTPNDTAAVLVYNALSTDLFSGAFSKINRPVLFAYQPQSRPSADLLRSKLGETVRLERFDGDGHALFVDNPEKFNRVLEQFVQGLAK